MKFYTFFARVLLLVLLTGLTKTPGQSLNNESKKEIVNRISSMLNERYVFPDVAEKCGEHIKNKLSSGAFDSITQVEEFASVLTSELQSISKDKHMRVRADRRQNPDQDEVNPFLREFYFREQNRKDNFGFAKVEFLEGGIGYLDLRFFAPLLFSQKYAENAMGLLSNANALIIDLRKNRGGNPDLISFISSYFFDEPTHLNSLYYREGNRTEEFWTRKIEESTLTDVPIFVLTSSFTFSGGEEFANNLKTRERAVIIGETTGGGANPGGMFRINEELAIFIPTGKAVNPVTNSNWEGTGVEPHIKVPSDEAYDTALIKAGIAAEEYLKLRQEKARRFSDNMNSRLNEAERILDKDKEQSETLVKNALDEGIEIRMVDENTVNLVGYDYMAANKFNMAIVVFKYNTLKFPRSANTYDSLGEAYMMNNQYDLAIANYRKSLELDPENKNAKEMIAKMSNKTD